MRLAHTYLTGQRKIAAGGPLTYQSAKSGAANSLVGGSLTITRASWGSPPATGYQLIAFLNTYDANFNASNASWTTPTGWTQIASTVASDSFFAVYKRTATGDASDNFVASDPNNGGSYSASAFLYSASNVTTVSVSSITTGSNELSIVAPSLGSAGNIILCGWGAAAAIARTVTYPGTMTGETVISNPNANAAAARETLGTAGTRTTTWTGSNFSNATYAATVALS